MTTHLTLHAGPGAGFDEPFEMLLACHQRVERMLGLLERLGAHLVARGCDADARRAAADVMRYFDLTGPAHHEDEERHLFPALRERGGPGLQAVVARLAQEHRTMARQWGAVRADLLSAAEGRWSVNDDAAAGARWVAFAALYRAHIAVEESQAYPAARPLFDTPAQAAMGREMARRRGAR